MEKLLTFSALLFAVLFLTTSPVLATAYTISNTTSTSPQTLNMGDSLTVSSTGTLTVNTGTIVAVTVNGNSTITNSGVIDQDASGRAIRSVSTGSTLTVTNYGTIEASGNDAFQMNKTGSVTLYNYGTVSASGSGAQALNWNVSNSTGTDTPYSNTVYNYAGGSITAYEADAIRPGASGTIYNSGTIKSTGGSGDTSSSDGIDAQDNNSGITIINGATQTVINGTASANLIEGERHGITGGQQVDTATGGAYDKPFKMSITNNANSTI